MLKVRYGYWAIDNDVVEKYSISIDGDTYVEKHMCSMLNIRIYIFREIMEGFNATPRGEYRYYTFETKEDAENAIVALKLIGVV